MEAVLVTLLLLWSCTSKDDSEGSSVTDSRELTSPVDGDTAIGDTGTGDATTDDTANGVTVADDTAADDIIDDTATDDTAAGDTADVDTGDAPIELLVDPSFELGSEHWNIWGGAERVMGVGATGD